ncbi:hypothetical protein OOK13_04640 [Streptomyces sp. NBC_00378]|uniref:hypothetical protein n=1 Tax=unclassified Streptomyces TaxID=2593676 RepID=UPI00225A6DF3|nr:MULTISPECIES: hypothetical protein [unclassified Streptomyces]MCX5107814.1 hypothetical protein [Streptomyces sp. NBC_00378]
MSGSPKYSTVTVAPAYARLEAQRRRARETARRRLEAQRARERAERAAVRAKEAAARRERARAEAERRETELANRRAVRQQDHAARLLRDQAGADGRRLAEVRELLDQVRTDGLEAQALRQRLDLLQGRVDRAGIPGGHPGGAADGLGGAIEELRGRIVLLVGEARESGRGADHGTVLAGFESRLAGIGPEARDRDPQGYQQCVGLVGELRAATGPGGETRFQALLGTVEHALARHAATAGERAAEALREAERARETQRQAEERAVAQEAARQAARDAEQERLAEQIAEAADRLGVVRQAVQEAVAEARELAEPELAERIEAALTAVTAPLAAGAGAAALTAVAALEGLLVSAESQLDEAQLAYTRRMDLAEALQDAMIGEGFAFTGGAERDGRLLLSFERPSGATYETTVTEDGEGTPVLVYHVDGEPDVVLRPEPDGAVCDRTEDLLERVHEAIVERDGFVPGRLAWQGKPPGRQAKRRPGEEEQVRTR